MPKVKSKKGDNLSDENNILEYSPSNSLEVDEIVQHIFGEGFQLLELQNSLGKTSPSSQKAYNLECVTVWTNRVFDELEETENFLISQLTKHRIGPPVVRFDISSHAGLFMIGKDRLSVSSQGNFGSIRANSCVYKGKWQYETNLSTSGVMQIGWATSNCRFATNMGVGDTASSFGFDGNRVRKWNITCGEYGETWLRGDTIGCTINLDAGIIEYYRNGKSMGEAFNDIKMGPGIAYFPAVSLAFTEQLVANFGATPLRYPVSGYLPMQDPPYIKVVQSEQLSKWVLQLLDLYEDKLQMLEQSVTATSDDVGIESFLMSIAERFFQRLGPLLALPYITESCLLPMIEVICVPPVTKNKTGNNVKSKLMILLDMLWSFLEEHELHPCLDCLVGSIVNRYRQVSADLDYSSQKHYLLLMVYIVQHTTTRQYLLEHVLVEKSRFAHFTYVKPLAVHTLEELVKNPWWPSEPKNTSIENNKAPYLKACQLMKESISVLEAIQVELLKAMLDNTDSSDVRPSSRKIFLKKFRGFLHENLITHQALPMMNMPHHITLCCFHRLLEVFRMLWEQEVAEYPVVLPCNIFYDGTFNYFRIDRLGGDYSHLLTEFKTELIRVLGADHKVLAKRSVGTFGGTEHLVIVGAGADAFVPPAAQLNQMIEENPGMVIPIMARIAATQPINGPVMFERFFLHARTVDNQPTEVGVIQRSTSLLELFDGLVLFYHTSVHHQLSKLNEMHLNMNKYIGALNETTSRLDILKSNSPGPSDTVTVISELERSCNVFKKELADQSRILAWNRALDLSSDKQTNLVRFIMIILQTIKSFSSKGVLFSFLPDFYLDSLVEVCLALRTYLPPSAPFEDIEGHGDLLIEVAEFLCDHFADPRIVHDNSKDTMIHALASFVCKPNTLEALEKVPAVSRMQMVRMLLRPYENRAWAQSNSVLVRIWQGCGFAFRYETSPHLQNNVGTKLLHSDSGLICQGIKPCPSMLYQRHVQEILLDKANVETTVAFLHSLLNQLNWAFSEFIGMLQEIQNVSTRPEPVLIDSRQLKICATCFDLALALLRVLEMIVTIAPQIFTDPNRQSSDLLLARMCQLMCQVLNRVSSQTGCFQHVVLLQKSDLDTVDHFPILAAVVGILAALLSEDMDTFDDEITTVPRVSRALVTEPSFQVDSLHFVLGDLKTMPKRSAGIKTFTFRNYAEDVSADEISTVERMIHMLGVHLSRISDVTLGSDDNLCTICYARSISATFRPCNHESCSSCIAHYLMNSHLCFFCKMHINKVVGTDGTVLHELPPPVQTNRTDRT